MPFFPEMERQQKKDSAMSTSQSQVVVLSGPNGAGKSTAAPRLLKGTLMVTEFVNARVAQRVLTGGHDVPLETIRRRYHAGLVNFRNLYQPL